MHGTDKHSTFAPSGTHANPVCGVEPPFARDRYLDLRPSASNLVNINSNQ